MRRFILTLFIVVMSFSFTEPFAEAALVFRGTQFPLRSNIRNKEGYRMANIRAIKLSTDIFGMMGKANTAMDFVSHVTPYIGAVSAGALAYAPAILLLGAFAR